jgi:hypothetical protein
MAGFDESRFSSDGKKNHGAHTALRNISSDNILLMTPIRSWGTFFTSSDVTIVRLDSSDSWIQNQLSRISTGFPQDRDLSFHAVHPQGRFSPAV